LDVGIRAEHSPELGIVDPAVHVDEAAVVELLVAGVAAVVVLAAGAKRIGIGRAEVQLGACIPPLAPGVEGLALGAGIGEGGAIPCAGVDDIGGAEVVF
jgi:hypothetical protein